MTDSVAVQKIAVALLENLLKSLSADQPTPPPEDEATKSRLASYRERLRKWYRGRRRDVRWILSPGASAIWVEAAGLEYDSFVSGLRSRVTLEIPDRPEDLGEET